LKLKDIICNEKNRLGVKRPLHSENNINDKVKRRHTTDSIETRDVPRVRRRSNYENDTNTQFTTSTQFSRENSVRLHQGDKCEYEKLNRKDSYGNERSNRDNNQTRKIVDLRNKIGKRQNSGDPHSSKQHASDVIRSSNQLTACDVTRISSNDSTGGETKDTVIQNFTSDVSSIKNTVKLLISKRPHLEKELIGACKEILTELSTAVKTVVTQDNTNNKNDKT